MQEKNISIPTNHHRIALWLFSLFPNILLVALCNSRAMGEENKNSDIDLFIIAKSWQLWTTRFLVTFISGMLGVRRWSTHDLAKWSPKYIKKTKDKFCLSFFITEDAMNLDTIRIENDIYLDKWIENLVPLVNKNNILEQFWTANKKPPIIHSSLFIHHSIIEILIKIFWLPHTLRTYQKLGKPWWVIISDTMLKFHDNDQRKVYRDKYIKE